MQISPLNVESLLPLANKGTPAAAEAGKGFSRSLQDQEQVRSRQKPPEPAKETRTEPQRSHDADSGKETRSKAEEPDRKDIEKGSRHARRDDHAEDRDRSPDPSVTESGRLPKAAAGKPEIGGHESRCLENIGQGNAEALPVQVAGFTSLAPQSPLVDDSAEGTAGPAVVAVEAEPSVLPVPFVEEGVVELPVESEIQLDENIMAGSDVTTDVGYDLAAPVAGPQSSPEVPRVDGESGEVVAIVAKNEVAEDSLPSPSVQAHPVISTADPVAPTAVPAAPSPAAEAIAVPVAPVAGATPLAADIPALENSDPVSPLKALDLAEPAVSSQKKWAGFAPVRHSQGASVAAAGPAVDGKAVVESLQIGVPLTTKPIQQPLATDVTGATVMMSTEVAQSLLAVPLKKPTLLKGADPGNTSDQRFAQLLGDKGFSSKVVDAKAVVVESPVEAALAEAADVPADAMMQRLGTELKSNGAKSSDLGLAKIAVDPGSVGGNEAQFGGASPGNGPPSVVTPSAASVAGMPPRLPIAEEQIFEQVVGRLSLANGERQSKVTMKLYPEELGQVRLEMSVVGDRVRVHMHAQSQQVQDVLEKYLPRLRESFENQGLKLEDVQVSSDSSQQGGKGFFQQQQAEAAPRYFTRRSFRGGDVAEIDPPVVSLPASRTGGINLHI